MAPHPTPMMTTGQTHEKPNRADSRRGWVAIRVLFRGAFVRGDDATPRTASMDVARESRSRPCRSTTPKHRGEWLTPEPLSVPGARALLSVQRRSSCEFVGVEIFAALRALVHKLPSVAVAVLDRGWNLVGFDEGKKHFGLGGVGAASGDMGSGVGMLDVLAAGAGLRGVDGDGVHFVVSVGVAPLTGDGERFAHCPNVVNIFFAQCPNYFHGPKRGSFSPLNEIGDPLRDKSTEDKNNASTQSDQPACSPLFINSKTTEI